MSKRFLMEWINIQHRLPRDNEYVLVWDGYEKWQVARKDKNLWLGSRDILCDVKYWMPLAEPPNLDLENPQGYPHPIKPFEDK